MSEHNGKSIVKTCAMSQISGLSASGPELPKVILTSFTIILISLNLTQLGDEVLAPFHFIVALGKI